MRHFTSYGPPDPKKHFTVERKKLVEKCLKNLIGDPPEDGGYFFTIWAPRQTGKTWLINRVVTEIKNRYPDKFLIADISVENLFSEEKIELLDIIIETICRRLKIEYKEIKKEREFERFFFKGKVIEKPLILIIDEVDCLRGEVLEYLMHSFRKMYLYREDYILHGLALVGVRAVLGVEAERGSPFNIQRSLKVENFSYEEVKDLFEQYQRESGQKVEEEVIRLVYEKTDGQPGLVGWFGELLTEKYNPGVDKPIDKKLWDKVYIKALYVEPNNTVLNIIKKAFRYKEEVLKIYQRDDVKFSFSIDWCNYLYMHGVIREEEGVEYPVCRIANEFIQARLFDALSGEYGRIPGPYLEPLDTLDDVLKENCIKVKPLIERFKKYLERTKSKDIYKGKEVRRSNGRIYESIYHFYLYTWIFEVLKDYEVRVIPEFPLGNGRIDIVIKDKKENISIIEVKSFINIAKLKKGKEQLESYAKKLKAKEALMALFVDFDEERYLKAIKEEYEKESIKFYIEPIVIL